MVSVDDLKVTRRRLLSTGLSMVIITAVLLVMYSLAPVNSHPGESIVLRILIVVIIFIAVVSLEVRSIIKHKFPQLRAIRALAVILPLFFISFAWLYLNYSIYDPTMFDVSLNKTSAFYFTMTVFSTVGFGDITPKSSLAQIIVTIQMVADLILIAVGVNAILKVGSRKAASNPKDQD